MKYQRRHYETIAEGLKAARGFRQEFESKKRAPEAMLMAPHASGTKATPDGAPYTVGAIAAAME